MNRFLLGAGVLAAILALWLIAYAAQLYTVPATAFVPLS